MTSQFQEPGFRIDQQVTGKVDRISIGGAIVVVLHQSGFIRFWLDYTKMTGDTPSERLAQLRQLKVGQSITCNVIHASADIPYGDGIDGALVLSLRDCDAPSENEDSAPRTPKFTAEILGAGELQAGSYWYRRPGWGTAKRVEVEEGTGELAGKLTIHFDDNCGGQLSRTPPDAQFGKVTESGALLRWFTQTFLAHSSGVRATLSRAPSDSRIPMLFPLLADGSDRVLALGRLACQDPFKYSGDHQSSFNPLSSLPKSQLWPGGIAFAHGDEEVVASALIAGNE